jgi:hypothetical protein
MPGWFTGCFAIEINFIQSAIIAFNPKIIAMSALFPVAFMNTGSKSPILPF